MSDPGVANLPEYSVSELSGAVKRLVEDNFDYVRVRGELGRVSRPASGHVYLDLKDERAVLSGVIWKGVASRLRTQPEQGLEVIATGKLTTFPGQSRYQIIIEALEPAGAGALMALLEERRKKLAAEGLFEAARKQLLPDLPRVIGVVTSPSGAVIRDILHRIADRFPLHVIVWPTKVQGEGAAEGIAAGVAGFNALPEDGPIPRPDVLIVARGGGSLEDLWCFNEEIVVRTAAASEIPLISAVGHETDTTLIDHAADIRAPTPTAAAEIAVPVRSELMGAVDDLARRHAQAMTRLAENHRVALAAAARGLPRLADLLALPRQRLDEAAGRLGRGLIANARAKRVAFATVSGRLQPGRLALSMKASAERVEALSGRLFRAQATTAERRRDRLERLSRLLETLSHQATLERGFALVRDATGALVRSAKGHQAGDALEVEFADGRLGVAVGAGKARYSGAAGKGKAAKGAQGSLF